MGLALRRNLGIILEKVSLVVFLAGFLGTGFAPGFFKGHNFGAGFLRAGFLRAGFLRAGFLDAGAFVPGFATAGFLESFLLMAVFAVILFPKAPEAPPRAGRTP